MSCLRWQGCGRCPGVGARESAPGGRRPWRWRKARRWQLGKEDCVCARVLERCGLGFWQLCNGRRAVGARGSAPSGSAPGGRHPGVGAQWVGARGSAPGVGGNGNGRERLTFAFGGSACFEHGFGSFGDFGPTYRSVTWALVPGADTHVHWVQYVALSLRYCSCPIWKCGPVDLSRTPRSLPATPQV